MKQLTINDENTAGTPPDGVTSPATYKSSENVPSVRILLPTPRFSGALQPKPEPVASTKPATFALDKAGQQPQDNPAATAEVVTHQQTDLSPLSRPTRFSPELMRHVPVELPPVDDAKPATARLVHDVSKAQNR